MTRLRYSLFLLMLLPVALPLVAEELLVVAHPDSGFTEMSRKELVNIYMGRYQKLPSGGPAYPVDLIPRREVFYDRLLGKTLAEVNSYWARLVFSGRASPPRWIDNASDVIDLVARNPGAIGYLDAGQIDVRVVVVHRLPAGAAAEEQ